MVMGPNIVDEIDCGNLFDQIDDLIDFPPDNECHGDGNLVGLGDGKDFMTWDDALADCDHFLSGSHVNSASDLSTELYVPYDDIVQLERLPTFAEDSFSSIGLTLGKDNDPSAIKFQTSSPVSVFESSSSTSSSSSAGKNMLPLSPNHCGPQRARSKRPRPTTFNPQPAIRHISPSSSSVKPDHNSSESYHFAELPTKKIRKSTGVEYKKTNKIIKKNMLSAIAPHEDNTVQDVRKCLHCEITKTPQWRAGPMGPKTLCNACGVRYKSGRLFPEYRPAASPTFVPSLHSNSHKKVVEMRSKVGPSQDNTTFEDLKVAPDS
ncbi:hypothetical protein CASFOL_006141 [Castilleja foliolosa]|uniref:GATA transcription factor n=1 Tax=Castilleja foliolosa TaxID=1961234 RepID=A0ABD3E5H9_9LAMI